MRYEDGKKLIVVEKGELLAVLETNRAEHNAVFQEALQGYREQAIARLDLMLRDAKEGRGIQQYIGLSMPADHTRDYDRTIQILKMTVESLIPLTEPEFAMYVMDDWQWKRDFLTGASSYSTLASSLSFKNGYTS